MYMMNKERKGGEVADRIGSSSVRPPPLVDRETERQRDGERERRETLDRSFGIGNDKTIPVAEQPPPSGRKERRRAWH